MKVITELSILKRKQLVAFLLLIQSCLLGYSATRHSPTTLEPGFLVSGLSHWQFERFELFRVNPPLPRIVAALPIHLLGYENNWTRYYDGPGSRAEFRVGEDFILCNGLNVFRLFGYARWACIPFSLIGSYVAFRWSKDLYGNNAGLFTLTLFVFEPNLLAHGELVTSDAACTAFGLLAGYTFWHWIREPNWPKTCYAGIALGLAELTKMTWLVLFGLWPLLWLIFFIYFRECLNLSQGLTTNGQNQSNFTNLDPSDRVMKEDITNDTIRNLKSTSIKLVAILLIAIYLLNLGYLFDGTFTQLKKFTFVSSTLTGIQGSEKPGNRFQHSIFGEIPIPLPKQYVLGLDSQKKDFENFNYPSYLRGKWQDHGWWYYYLYGLLVKVPCGIWGIFLVCIICRLFNIKKNPRLSLSECVLISMSLALLIMISSQTGFSRHFRYALPAIGLLIVFSGQAMSIVSIFPPKSWMHLTLKIWFASMLVYTITSTLFVYPHQLSYFNNFAGGSENGYRHLLGSSNYWGQDLLLLKEWANQSHVNVIGYISATDLATFQVLFPQGERVESQERKIIVTNSEQLFSPNFMFKPTGERIGYTLWAIDVPP